MQDKNLTVNQVAEICGNNQDRIIKVAREIGADTNEFGVYISSWYEAAWAIVQSLKGVEKAEEMLKGIASAIA